MFFLFLLFFEGAIGLTYQLLFLRQLSPVVGSSNEVTGWIVGFFLGALSLGYRQGGQPSLEPLPQLGKNLLWCAFIAGISASSVFIRTFFDIGLSVQPNRIVILVLYCMFFIAPLAYFMGQSLPLLLQCNLRGRTAAEQGGNALSLSTIGSMAGAIIPTSCLAPWIGATNTLLANTGLSIVLGAILLRKTQSPNKARLLIFLAIIAQSILLWPYLSASRGYFTSTAHSDIYFLQQDGERLMYANDLVMSAQTEAGKNTTAYISAFQKTLQWHHIEQKDILVLGAGGFMAHTENAGRNKYTYVDIDASLVEWAIKHFRFDPSTVEQVVHDDARSFLLNTPDAQWSVIFMDTFGSRFSMPEHLMTAEFFALAKQKLSPGGLFIINAIMNPDFSARFDRRFHAAVTEAFPYCQVTQVTPGTTQVNMMYVCFAQETESAYRDDLHTISRDVWQSRQ